MELLANLSQKYGSGSVLGDAMLVLVAITTVALIVGLVTIVSRGIRGKSAAGGGFDRMHNIAGRVERLDRTVSELRTELMRAMEFVKGDIDTVRNDVALLRESLHKDGVLKGDIAAAPEPRAPSRRATRENILHGLFEAPLSSSEEQQDLTTEVLEPPQVSTTAGADLPDTARHVTGGSLASRLQKTRAGLFGKLRSLFSRAPQLDATAVEQLEELLVSSDIGIGTATQLINEIKGELSAGAVLDQASLSAHLKMKILSILDHNAPLSAAIKPQACNDGPLVVMVIGVNGVGKTTTVAKLASQFKASGARVLMVAADTFRAAAVDQLAEWGARIGVPVVCGAPNAKPATVVFDGMQAAQQQSVDVVIIDTAGRLHNKANLMQELEGVRNAIVRHQSSAPHEVLLVVDGATGQNAISQAREFHAATPLTGLVVTKLDGTPKGGVVVAIKAELGIPVRYIGVGESQDDLRPFDAREFVEALFDTSGLSSDVESDADASAPAASAHGQMRRQRREG